MTKRFAASALMLVLGIAAFAGSAFAGNGNGKDNGKADTGGAAAAAPASEGSAPGNSANAPGHLKKEAASAEATGGGSVEQAAVTQVGVKPSNETAHDTHAAATSNETKLYGNGKNAGQIAMQNGARPNAVLHGPGNSQPHKTAPCSGGHEVDVHALKAKRHRKGCGTTSPPQGSTPGTKPSPNTDPVSKPNMSPGSNASGSSISTPGSTGSPAKPNARPSSGVQASSAVLAAAEVVGPATLPFTGFPLWTAVLIGMALIVIGLALVRAGAGATAQARSR